MRISLILSLLIHFSCASEASLKVNSKGKSQDKLPRWVSHPSEKYPNEWNLLGLGVSSNKKMAENDAMNSIAKIFRSKIKVDERLISQVQEQDGDRNSFNRSTNVIKTISVSANQTLLNTKIAEFYYDQNEKKYYALAVMEKQSTADLIKKEIKRNRSEIVNWKQSFLNENDNLKRFNYLFKMKRLFALSKTLAEMLPLLDAFEENLDYGTSEQELVKEEQALSQNLAVSIQSSQDLPKKIRKLIEKELTNFGFQLGASGKLIFEVNYDKEKIENSNNPAKFIQWDLSISCSYEGKDIAVFERSGRDGQLSFKAAQKRVELKLKKLLAKSFPRFLETELFK